MRRGPEVDDGSPAAALSAILGVGIDHRGGKLVPRSLDSMNRDPVEGHVFLP
jgi:hypothetical protein